MSDVRFDLRFPAVSHPSNKHQEKIIRHFTQCVCVCVFVFLGALIHQMDTHHFSKEHVDIVTETLLHVFCGKDMKVRSGRSGRQGTVSDIRCVEGEEGGDMWKCFAVPLCRFVEQIHKYFFECCLSSS